MTAKFEGSVLFRYDSSGRLILFRMNFMPEGRSQIGLFTDELTGIVMFDADTRKFAALQIDEVDGNYVTQRSVYMLLMDIARMSGNDDDPRYIAGALRDIDDLADRFLSGAPGDVTFKVLVPTEHYDRLSTQLAGWLAKQDA